MGIGKASSRADLLQGHPVDTLPAKVKLLRGPFPQSRSPRQGRKPRCGGCPSGTSPPRTPGPQTTQALERWSPQTLPERVCHRGGGDLAELRPCPSGTANTSVGRRHRGVHGGKDGELGLVDVLLCESPSLSPVDGLRKRLERFCRMRVPRRPERLTRSPLHPHTLWFHKQRKPRGQGRRLTRTRHAEDGWIKPLTSLRSTQNVLISSRKRASLQGQPGSPPRSAHKSLRPRGTWGRRGRQTPPSSRFLTRVCRNSGTALSKGRERSGHDSATPGTHTGPLGSLGARKALSSCPR